MPKKRTDGTQYSQAQTDGDEDVLAPESKTGVNDAEIEEADVNVAEFARRMNLEILYSGDNQTIHFCTFNISRPGLQLAGYYKHFSAERVQVIGEMEMAYLQQMTHDARKTACESLLKKPIPCLIITSAHPPCDELLDAVRQYKRILLSYKKRTDGFVRRGRDCDRRVGNRHERNLAVAYSSLTSACRGRRRYNYTRRR